MKFSAYATGNGESRVFWISMGAELQGWAKRILEKKGGRLISIQIEREDLTDLNRYLLGMSQYERMSARQFKLKAAEEMQKGHQVYYRAA